MANLTKQEREEFISRIAAAVQKYAPSFGIKVYSPIIAQAIHESGYGTTDKAKYNNFFGLKYNEKNPDRVPAAKGKFIVSNSYEQRKDGSVYNITCKWYSFETLEEGVLGYFQFLDGYSHYNCLKGVTDPKKYLELIWSAGYASSLTYVDKVYKVLTSWNLTKYDKISAPKEETKWYRVRKSWEDKNSQLGAYINLDNAIKMCEKKSGYNVYDYQGNQVYPKDLYKIRITIAELNIRKGPGLQYQVVGTIKDRGTYTIIEECDGWGKLKGGAGWIFLGYTKKA